MGEHGRLRRCRPALEGLEERRPLTSTFTSYYALQAAQVRHEYDHFVSEVQTLELRSQATPAEYLALRDDTRAISEDAATTTLAPAVAASNALAASIEIDRAPLYGSLGDEAWAQERANLAARLDGLNVPASLVDRTIADMKAVAASAGVTADAYQTLTDDLNAVRRGESEMAAGYGHIPDPALFYTQHLRGFFRGWATERTADQARLTADIHASAGASPSELAVLNRDAGLLEALGAPVPSAADDQILAGFASVFAQGDPDPARLSAFRSAVVPLLGTTATPARLADLDRLIADAPAFFRAAGSSSAAVGTITEDVRAVVNDGAGASLDPFKITTRPGASG